MLGLVIALATNTVVWIPVAIWIRRRAVRARAVLADTLGGHAPDQPW